MFLCDARKDDSKNDNGHIDDSDAKWERTGMGLTWIKETHFWLKMIYVGDLNTLHRYNRNILL